jgi:DNA-binding transcriptional MerR regulator
MIQHFTSGQVARKLRISSSTLKRWLDDPELDIPEQRNTMAGGFFSDEDIVRLKEYRRQIRVKENDSGSPP